MDHFSGFRWWMRRLLFRLGLSGPPPAMWFQREPRSPFWRRGRVAAYGPTVPAAFKAPPPPPWSGPRESELGVAVPVRAILASTPKVVVALTDCVAFSNGFEVAIAARSREEMDQRAMGFGPGPPWERPREGLLEIWVTFADGREGRTSGHGPSPQLMEYYYAAREGGAPPAPEGPLVMQCSGSSGGKRADFRYWVWPLPPEGPVTVTCRWPAADVPITRLELDGRAIRRAGAGSQDLWQ